MLLDTASLYFRAFFGVPDSVRAPDGTPVNAVRGLLDFIARLVGQYEPTHLACCWDNDWRPQWRVDLLPTYKAHRVEYVVADGVDVEETPDPLETQVPIILDVLDALGLAVVGADGYEADDVIGTLSERAAEGGMPADIVTGDRDLFQLVDDARAVRVLYTARGVGKHEIIDEAAVVRRYAVLPEQYADFATMRGDSSDGLPGVAGVGEKTAASLLRTYGDLDSIVAAAADGTSTLSATARGRLTAAADYLAVAPRVVAVCRDLDLGAPVLDLPYPAPRDPVRFAELTEQWGLGGSADRVVDALMSRS
ncbi:MAG: flap endonuclease [Actinomycetota bacterium]|nr:flap endonuclease [Actinomycetota bacterium]